MTITSGAPLPSAPASLPDAIARYIAGANAADSEAVAASFTPGAVVRDEGKDWTGRAAIVQWKEETTRKYRPQTAVTGVESRQGQTLVTASVSGDFAGSPVVLTYAFTLKDGLIDRLRIVA
ncbi:MAG: nuclear transport factor 2 family protein [Haliea sp.]|nr:MAG: nuclear transport factor 2 family protein [Haliea sp.]